MMILGRRQAVSGVRFLNEQKCSNTGVDISPLYIFSHQAYSIYIMNTVRHIFYVDAHYSYEPDLLTKEYYTHKEDLKVESTSVHFFDAYGYVEKHGDNIVVAFIKKKGASPKDTIRSNEKIIKGIIIPDTALLSKARTCSHDVLKGAKKGSRVAVTWRDIVYVANLPRYDCAIMYTEGILYKIEKDHIVLKDTETIRVHPMPVINHPAGKPLWYTIPISFIKDVEVIS